MSAFTLVVTSCDRHDLLRRTLDSFIDATDAQPRETIVVEDGPTVPAFLSEQKYNQLGKVTVLHNERRMGQIYSIDRAYAQVKTEFILHCEDDWEFKQQGFCSKSIAILNSYPEIIQVSLRGDTGWHPLITTPAYPFKIAEPYWHGGWGGIAFNPGMRRLIDYKALGSYGKVTGYGTHGLGHELTLSKLMLDKGFRIAELDEVFVEHIGNNRSRAIEPLESLPKVLIAVPACRQLIYGKYESDDSPLFDKTNKGYGTGIHITQTNTRIDAVRNSWFKDIEPFKTVTGKFFFGRGNTVEAPDETVLDCPDDYESLPAKTIAICQYARDNDYDYLFKADDDTFVFVNRLMGELVSNRFDYAGYDHAGVATGGPGYWLSRRAISHVADSTPSHWAEDCHVSKTLGMKNIRPLMLGNHYPGFAEHWFDVSKVPEGAVTLHAVRPEDMKKVK